MDWKRAVNWLISPLPPIFKDVGGTTTIAGGFKKVLIAVKVVIVLGIIYGGYKLFKVFF